MEDHGVNDVVGDPEYRGFGIVWENEGEPDVLMRMKNGATGQEITLLSAPPHLFPDNGLGPLVTAFEDQVIVSFNDERLDEMFDEAIRANGEVYGEGAAVMLPITLLIRLAMKAAEPYFGT